MTESIVLDSTSADPSFGMPKNPAKDELEHILNSLSVPANFRVVLTVDRTTEMLHLRVQRISPWVFKVGGVTLLRFTPSWDRLEATQRQLTARTYASLLSQLKESPEFLEFELVVDGNLAYREASLLV